MNWIIRILLSALAVLGLAHFLDGIQVSPMETAIWVALLLGVLNTILRPLLILFTIPITIMTLGLFLLVINASIVLLCDHFISGFQVGDGSGGLNAFLWALLFSILLSILQGILYRLFGVKKGQKN